MRWDVGLSTGIAYREPIEAVLPLIAECGFRTIEVATARWHLDLSDTSRHRAIAATLERLGLRAPSLHAPFGQGIDITDPDPAIRERSLHRLREAADVLQTLGGELYVIHPGGEDHDWVWEREERLRRSVEGLEKVWELCRERTLTLVVETPLPHLLGGQLEDFDWILSRVPREGTGVCIDTSHTSLAGTLFEAIERWRDRIVHVQASDNRGRHDDHLPPGAGIIDWARVLGALERIRYRGIFLLEINGEANARDSVVAALASAERLFPDLTAGSER